MSEMAGKMLTLCNSYTPPEMRDVCVNTVKEMLMLWPSEMLNILVPILHRAHSSASSDEATNTLGPFFPRKGAAGSANVNVKAVRPPR